MLLHHLLRGSQMMKDRCSRCFGSRGLKARVSCRAGVMEYGLKWQRDLPWAGRVPEVPLVGYGPGRRQGFYCRIQRDCRKELAVGCYLGRLVAPMHREGSRKYPTRLVFPRPRRCDACWRTLRPKLTESHQKRSWNLLQRPAHLRRAGCLLARCLWTKEYWHG